MDNTYYSIICEYCPYTEFGSLPSEYVSGRGTYVACEGNYCEEAYKYYIEETGDNTPIEELF